MDPAADEIASGWGLITYFEYCCLEVDRLVDRHGIGHAFVRRNGRQTCCVMTGEPIASDKIEYERNCWN